MQINKFLSPFSEHKKVFISFWMTLKLRSVQLCCLFIRENWRSTEKKLEKDCPSSKFVFESSEKEVLDAEEMHTFMESDVP